MRSSLTILIVIGALSLAGCPRQEGPAPLPKSTTAYSSELGIRVTYNPGDFSSVAHGTYSEFPLYFTGENYNFGIKRLANVGILLAKEPQADFFKFFAQQIRYDLITVGKLNPLEPEKDEEFTAQGKPGLRQVLHFKVPDKLEKVPSFIPQEPNAEVWVYYHHFYMAPDYYFFVVVSKQALTQPQLDAIVDFIGKTQFKAQPMPNGN
jgi:hypothetical protein